MEKFEETIYRPENAEDQEFNAYNISSWGELVGLSVRHETFGIGKVTKSNYMSKEAWVDFSGSLHIVDFSEIEVLANDGGVEGVEHEEVKEDGEGDEMADVNDKEDDERDIEDLFLELSEGWGDVFACRRENAFHDNNEDKYVVRNHTDEGLGADEWKSAWGQTLEDALKNALAGDFDHPCIEDGD